MPLIVDLLRIVHPGHPSELAEASGFAGKNDTRLFPLPALIEESYFFASAVILLRE